MLGKGSVRAHTDPTDLTGLLCVVVNLTEFLRKGSHRLNRIQQKCLFGGFVQFVVSHSLINSWLVFATNLNCVKTDYFQWMAVRKRRYATAAMMATIV